MIKSLLILLGTLSLAAHGAQISVQQPQSPKQDPVFNDGKVAVDPVTPPLLRDRIKPPLIKVTLPTKPQEDKSTEPVITPAVPKAYWDKTDWDKVTWR